MSINTKKPVMFWEGWAQFEVTVSNDGTVVVSEPYFSDPLDLAEGFVSYATQVVRSDLHEDTVLEVEGWPANVAFSAIPDTIRGLCQADALPFKQCSHFALDVLYEYVDLPSDEDFAALRRGEMHDPDVVQPRGFRKTTFRPVQQPSAA